jgi:uroporphyrinogen-III synthase
MTDILRGLRVLNTRPHQQGQSLTANIRQLGGHAIDLPALVIEATPIASQTPMPNLTTVNHAIFISPNAVKYFFSTHKQQWPKTITVTAQGHATAMALSKQGIIVHLVPDIADSEHLLQQTALQNVKNQSILLIKGTDGRQLIEETLQTRGALVTTLAVYCTRLPVVNPKYIERIWQEDAVDIILFTSQQAMRNLFILFADAGRDFLCHKPCLVISQRLAVEASRLGIKQILTCRYDNILNALKGFQHDHQHK